jgi:hypothetical protein
MVWLGRCAFNIEEQKGKWHYGKDLRESAEAKAERWIGEALRLEGVEEVQLRRWRKGHPYKVKLANKLRSEATVTVEWLARRLQMGTRGHLAHLLSRAKSDGGAPAQPTLGL